MPGALFARERSPYPAGGLPVSPVRSGAPGLGWAGGAGLAPGLGDSCLRGDAEGGALLPSPERAKYPDWDRARPDPKAGLKLRAEVGWVKELLKRLASL